MHPSLGIQVSRTVPRRHPKKSKALVRASVHCVVLGGRGGAFGLSLESRASLGPDVKYGVCWTMLDLSVENRSHETIGLEEGAKTQQAGNEASLLRRSCSGGLLQSSITGLAALQDLFLMSASRETETPDPLALNGKWWCIHATYSHRSPFSIHARIHICMYI